MNRHSAVQIESELKRLRTQQGREAVAGEDRVVAKVLADAGLTDEDWSDLLVARSNRYEVSA